MGKKRHVIFAVLAVAAIAVAVNFELSSRRAQASLEDPSSLPVVAVQQAVRGEISSSIRLSGDFRAYEEVDIHAKVAGYIRRIYVDVGDKVNEGQTLAVLEVPELTAQVVAARAAIRRSEDSIQRADKDVQRAESSHTAAHAAYARLKQASLARPGLIAEQELDDSLARDQEGEAQVGSARAALAEAKSALSVAEADQQHYAALEAYAHITAPFSGVVSKRYADTGALIQAGTASDTQSMPVVRLAQWSRLRLVVPVPESAVPNVHIGQTIDVVVPSLGRTFKGEVARFADALNAETRTMHTEIDVKNPDGALVEGMYAETTLLLDQKSDALTVPVEGVQRSGSKGTAYVVNASGIVEQRSLALGVDNGKRVEVLSGLNNGEQIVVGNLSTLQPGQHVRPKVVQPNESSTEGGL